MVWNGSKLWIARRPAGLVQSAASYTARRRGQAIRHDRVRGNSGSRSVCTKAFRCDRGCVSKTLRRACTGAHGGWRSLSLGHGNPPCEPSCNGLETMQRTAVPSLVRADEGRPSTARSGLDVRFTSICATRSPVGVLSRPHGPWARWPGRHGRPSSRGLSSCGRASAAGKVQSRSKWTVHEGQNERSSLVPQPDPSCRDVVPFSSPLSRCPFDPRGSEAHDSPV